MSLTPRQRHFLAIFVSDGEYNMLSTCRDAGVLPNEALSWFQDDAFLVALRKYDGAQLAAMGYGPLRVIRDVLDIAHSDIGEIQGTASISELPRRVRTAIKKAKFKAMVIDEQLVSYVSEVEMHDKAWALKQAAEWFDVANTPEVQKHGSTAKNDGPARIAGLIVRPPLTDEEKDIEDLLS